MESKWLPVGLSVKLCFNMKVLSDKYQDQTGLQDVYVQ